MSAAPPPHVVRPTTALLKALADDTRLRLLALLAHEEQCVCHLAAALTITQPNASQHLTVLRHAGVVDARRQGSWMYYRLREDLDPAQRTILTAVLAGLGADLAAEGDPARLTAARQELPCP